MQLRLEGLDPPEEIRPASGRAQPLIWVRRLRIVERLSRDDDDVIRDIELRRGLNIVWAPPPEAGDANALFRNGVQGHTAGKTTFCRLLRYALGEGALGTETTRRRIRERIPSGWVLAEVFLSGELWMVARPFAIGAHPFCCQGATIDEALTADVRAPFQAFLEAVTNCAVERLPARRFPSRDERIQWAHVLPWLTRDQECRFSDFLEWRHSSSDSDAPSLTAEERQFLVRSVLGLITDAERQEQHRNARLVAQKAEAAAKAPLREHEAAVDHRRVQRILGEDLPILSSGLFGTQARSSLDEKKAALGKEIDDLALRDQRSALQSKLEQAVATETEARRDREGAVQRLNLETRVLETLTGKQHKGLAERLPPGRLYCSVPLKLAHDQGCPLATGRPADLRERLGKQALEDEVENQRLVVTSLEGEVREREDALSRAEEATQAARADFLRAATEYTAARESLIREEEALQQAEGLVAEAEAAARQAEEQRTRVENLEREISESYQRQEQLRHASRTALGHFSATFDYVTRALLGDDVEGRADAAGRSLSLIVEHHGVRESAALASVKLLAFDLAALTESMRGHGFFPRFLLHDGPREADMSADIYERLFIFAGRLEECYEGDAGFQYIVTTTTPPPPSFASLPWLRVTLAGEPAEERLLRMDL